MLITAVNFAEDAPDSHEGDGHEADADVHAEIQSYIDLANQSVSKAESVRKMVILPTELSQETGHVTPSEKLRRASVIEDFDEAMDELYG